MTTKAKRAADPGGNVRLDPRVLDYFRRRARPEGRTIRYVIEKALEQALGGRPWEQEQGDQSKAA